MGRVYRTKESNFRNLFKKKNPITILDIGIGNARIAKHLSGIPEMWSMVESYDGTDNAKICVNISRQVAIDLKIDEKVKVYFLDALNLNQLEKHYD